MAPLRRWSFNFPSGSASWERCFNFAPFIPGFVEEDETGGGWWAVFLRVRHISFLFFFFFPFPLIFSMIENLGRGASGIG